ncbi:MAG: indolepyruvate ferredoxin oxidoreductase family protein [Acidobacteriota bacterium]
MKLSDRFTAESGHHYLTGIQALVRLPMDQMRLDRRASLRTGAFISGYEGSPLGGYDIALARAGKLLADLDIHFVPAVNEDLAATSILGTQILPAAGPARVDGVVGIWYGKGPGVDRSGDALRHANLAGTTGLSAALVLAGDDHACKSSSIPHHSDFSLLNFGIPILQPGTPQEILDYGLYAIALSRHSGAWTSLKLVTNICDGGASVDVALDRHRYTIPEGYRKVSSGMLVPTVANGLEVEAYVHRMDAVRAFYDLNPIDRIHGARAHARFGIAAAGKVYHDLIQSLRDLSLDAAALDALGIRIAQYALTYPISASFTRDFANGLETILVLEEKRSFLELQIKDALFNVATRPRVIGKLDDQGLPFVPNTGELDPDLIARLLLRALPPLPPDHDALTRRRLAALDTAAAIERLPATIRTPNYCPGCPHNRSTMLLEGQISGGGIGCHGMGMLLGEVDRGYEFAAQMGAEGAAWIGMAPFSNRRHIFQNMGDGTYFHSGSLAIEAAIAARINITYRILYNGHVSMTGGQDAIGAIPIPALTRKLEAEGVKRTIVLAEDTARYYDQPLAANAALRDRSALEDTLRELETIEGVSVLIYDQECAAEKRRKRSRGIYSEPLSRLVIHPRVCEGCGDCLRQSNCMSLVPLETPYGERMAIHQSSCNKDESCALGDCPSFVRIQLKPGGGLRKNILKSAPVFDPPAPAPTLSLDAPWRMLAPGIGGTGVVTVNALLAAAATIDGLYATTLDQTGLAQKGGAVVSHITVSREPISFPSRINTANTDLVLAYDPLGAANADNLRLVSPARARAVINTVLTPTAASLRQHFVLHGQPDAVTPIDTIVSKTKSQVCLDATALAETHFGSHMYANMILLGAAVQEGLLPISLTAIESAIRLNNVEVDRNLSALACGRDWRRQSAPSQPAALATLTPAQRIAELTAYQNAAWAARYESALAPIRATRPELAPIAERALFYLMTYKDEYEVARLLLDPAFATQLNADWQQIDRIEFMLHPPLLRSFGLKHKIKLGPSMRPLLALLARLKFVRGTALDLFGASTHRRRERSLIAWYEGILKTLASAPVSPESAELAALPLSIRGYESIKDRHIASAQARAKELLAALDRQPAAAYQS